MGRGACEHISLKKNEINFYANFGIWEFKISDFYLNALDCLIHQRKKTALNFMFIYILYYTGLPIYDENFLTIARMFENLKP